MDDREDKAREIVAEAKKGRKQPPRELWIASLVVAGIAVAALVIGYLTR